MDLAGIWQFCVDPQDRGVTESWFQRLLEQTIHLPGCLTAQGYGEAIRVDTDWTGDIIDQSWFQEARYEPYRQEGNLKAPFWLQPERYYKGAAWYQRQVEIPAHWTGKWMELFLERPHWETRLWVNDQEIGRGLSLSTPHVFNLGQLAPGVYRLTLRIDNRMIINVGPNSHSMTDHTQGNWNGIAGRIELRPRSPVWLRDIQVFPDGETKTVRVKIDADNQSGQDWHGQIILSARLYNVDAQHEPAPLLSPLTIRADGEALEVVVPLGENAWLWDEFQPALYHLKVQLDGHIGALPASDEVELSFGLRQIVPQGTQLALNGRRLFLRGTLECCIFPLTGYPPTDKAAWKQIIAVCQAHGLNHIRFHSYCPPQAAFEAADEMGFYYQVECASWANQGARLGDGDPLDAWLYAEAKAIIHAYGNHPSFLLMAYGNEPEGKINEYLGNWVDYWKEKDPRRVHTSGSGWPMLPQNQFHCTFQPRIQHWGAELGSRINALPPETHTDYSAFIQETGKPVIAHEIGQWCVYPNFAEITQYTGLLKAKNFEIFRDSLEANTMGDQAHDFLMASGKLQVLCYKEEIESALRTPGYAGFQLLDLHDFPGQGTALVGILDPFWRPKGYIRAAEFRRFCNSTVPLARMDRRYWKTSEIFQADIDLAHFGPEDISSPIAWKLVDTQGDVVRSGQLPPTAAATGTITRLGRVDIRLADLPPARKYTLVVGLQGNGCENDWDIWVFADDLPAGAPENIRIATRWGQETLDYLAKGETVLLLAAAEQVNAPSKIGFSSIFWNTAWTRGQAPHTLGVLVNPHHPVFADFPTEYHSNWQWWELVHGSAAMLLDKFPPALRPLIQPIDTWFENRRLGLLFEARVNGGRLMVCSMDLQTNLSQRLVARQMRYSLLGYMASEEFRPAIELSPQAVQSLFLPGRTSQVSL